MIKTDDKEEGIETIRIKINIPIFTVDKIYINSITFLCKTNYPRI